MRGINIFLEKLMFLAIIGIPIGIFMIVVQSDGRFSFAALATLVVTAVLILSFSILSPLLEIAANSRRSEELLRKIADNTRIQDLHNSPSSISLDSKSTNYSSGLPSTKPEKKFSEIEKIRREKELARDEAIKEFLQYNH